MLERETFDVFQFRLGKFEEPVFHWIKKILPPNNKFLTK